MDAICHVVELKGTTGYIVHVEEKTDLVMQTGKKAGKDNTELEYMV